MNTRSAIRAGSIICCFVAVFAGSSRAGEVEVRNIGNGGANDGQLDLSGTRTFDVLLDTGPTERILSQQIWLRLTQGHIVHHPLGSLAPPSTHVIDMFPAIEYDTFLASGVPNSSFVPSIVPGTSDELGHPPVRPETNNLAELDVLWGPELGINTRGSDDYLSTRITLSDDAVGMLSYRATFAVDFALDVTYGRIDMPIGLTSGSPEPSSALLVAVAVCAAGLAGPPHRQAKKLRAKIRDISSSGSA